MADRVCSVEACEKPHVARGWCSAHWTRWKRHGSPTARLRGEIVNGCRICTLCRVDKPLADFWRENESWCRDCFNERQRERARLRYVPVAKVAAICEVCGAEFMADKRQRLTCSPGCKKVGINKRNWKHVQKRRARLSAATTEVFDSAEIYERDAWICGLCGGEIDRTLRSPHPDSPSIDHIVPLALGGAHSRANTQAAHLGCNVRKGARLIEAVG